MSGLDVVVYGFVYIYWFEGNDVVVLLGVDFDIVLGEVVGLFGLFGFGKLMLFNLLVGLLWLSVG